MLFAGHQYFREAAGALDKYAPVTKEQQEHMKKALKKPLKQAVWEFPTDFAMFREQAVTNS